MAHFARIENNIVTNVIVVNNAVITNENGEEVESLGQEFCANLLGGEWLQTSYNNNFRGIYAGIGFTYDPEQDIFIAPVLEAE